MSLLNRLLPANWGTDPEVPDPGQPVKAAAAGGGVRPSLQSLYSRIYGLLRGEVSFESLVVAPAKVGGTPTATANGISIDFDNTRFISATIELTEPQVRVFGGTKNTSINDDSISSNWGFLADVQGVLHTLLGASARYAAAGITYTGVANPGRGVNSANKIIPALACKAWGMVRAANNAITSQDGEGGWSASIVGNRVRITLSQAFLDLIYVVNVTPIGVSGDFTALEDDSARTTSTFDLVFKAAGVERSTAGADVVGFQFSVHGRR